MTFPTSILARACGLLTLGAFLPACAQHVAAPAAATPASGAVHKPRPVSTIPINTAPNDTVLVFQRTPCHGTCPIYTATIFRNGKVAYEGERFVPRTGQHALALDPATVTAMLAEARRINFNGFAPSYSANVSDLPSTIITVYQPGQPRHKVTAEANIPAPLQQYIAYLRDKIDPLAGLSPQK
ncbi:DUF6438 domain-containing protein [Hymenobacter bucti]|uniref:DUF6438 domain-containing protein n=1 Tax=Hymenobacter bucti TaxID=1844114 RepID=A0ABW4QPN9_9BACT